MARTLTAGRFAASPATRVDPPVGRAGRPREAERDGIGCDQRGRGGRARAQRRHDHGGRLRPGRCAAGVDRRAASISSDATDLVIVSNNIGEPGRGLGKLLRQGRIRRGISSYFTSNPEAVAAVNAGDPRGDAPASGDLRRGDPGRWRRHRWLLHAGRRRHPAGRGQGGAGHRRRPPRARGAAAGRRRARVRRHAATPSATSGTDAPPGTSTR